MILILLSAENNLSPNQHDLVNNIFKKLNSKMYGISYKTLNNSFDVEEAISETFIKIINNIEKISSLPNNKIEAYCIVILKNETMNIIRKRKKLVHIDNFDILAKQSYETSAENEVIKISTKDEILNYINKLSYEERNLIYMRFVNNMKFKDIGILFNITEEAAKKRSQRILKKLNRYYKEDEIDV